MSASGDSRTKPFRDSADTTPVDNSMLELSRELGLLAGKQLAVFEKSELSSGRGDGSEPAN